MTYTWSPALETGYGVIDTQHKELIKTINDLMNACQQNHAIDEVNKAVDFLLFYTKWHFRNEEELQQKSNYPDCVNHHKYHEEFVNVVANLATELKQSGPTPAIVGKLVHSVGDWLVHHIQQQDTKVATHLKQAGM
jgi:hemerythrin